MQIASAAIPNNLLQANVTQIVPIFSGGGTRLSAHIGIIKALQDMNVGFDTLVGVSGGSIIASLYAKGYTVEQMRELALVTDFKQFTEFSLVRLLREGGLSSGDVFQRWIDEQLEGAVFADLPLNLHILATDVNGGGPVLFNKQTSPDMKVSEAVRYSMSIPLIFSFIPSPTVSDEPVYQAILNRGGIRYRSPRFSTVEQARKWRDQKLSELPECGSPIGRKILETISPQKEN